MHDAELECSGRSSHMVVCVCVCVCTCLNTRVCACRLPRPPSSQQMHMRALDKIYMSDSILWTESALQATVHVSFLQNDGI